MVIGSFTKVLSGSINEIFAGNFIPAFCLCRKRLMILVLIVTFKTELSSKNFAGSTEVAWPETIPDEKNGKSNSRYKIDFMIS